MGRRRDRDLLIAAFAQIEAARVIALRILIFFSRRFLNRAMIVRCRLLFVSAKLFALINAKEDLLLA